MKLTNKVYDVLKLIAQVILPAIGTLYFALAEIWALPDGKQVVGSITALDAFLGVMLSMLSSSYQPVTDGTLLIDKTNPAKDVYQLQIATALSAFDKSKTITLVVKPVSTPTE